MMKWLYSFLFFSVFIVIVSGCSMANYVIPAYTKLNFTISENVNPDLNGNFACGCQSF